MRTPVKWKRAPMRARAGSTRSNLPAETPPVMSSMSAWAAWASAASRASAVSAAVGRTRAHRLPRPPWRPAWGVGVVNLAGGGRGRDGNQFVAGGENGHAGAGVDGEGGVSAGSGQGNLREVDRGSGGEQLVACAGLRAAGHDIVARSRQCAAAAGERCRGRLQRVRA